ncbi:MAG: hypothetical protein Fur003_1720 [Candidatus Dojkabacteria bacterium]
MSNSISKNSIQLSIVIPTYKEGEFLGDLLESINQQFDAKKVEVIIVNRHSEDDHSSQIVTKYPFTFIELKSQQDSRNIQRNLGIEQSKGEWILFLDGDMRLGKDLVSQVLDTITNEDERVGFIITEHGEGKSFWAKVKAFEKELLIGNQYIEVARLYKRSILKEIGGFPDNIIGGEDKFVENKIGKKGEIGRVEGAYLIHNEGRAKFKQYLKTKGYYAQTIPSLRTGQKEERKWKLKDLINIVIDGLIRFLAPFRPKNWILLLRHPIRAIALFILRFAEWFSAVSPFMKRFSKKKLKLHKVLLLGAYGQGNLGDDLLLYSFIQKLGTNFKLLVKVDSLQYIKEKFSTKISQPVEFNSYLGIAGSLRLFKDLLYSKAVILGGGTLLFKCKTGFAYRLYIQTALIFLVAKLLGKKRVIAFGGIEPEKDKFAKLLLKVIYFLSNLIVLRDYKSYNYISQFSEEPLEKIVLANDVVWSLEADNQAKVDKRNKIAVTLLGNHNLDNIRKNVPEIIAKSVAAIKAINESSPDKYEFVLIPFLNDGSEIDDHHVLLKVAEELEKSGIKHSFYKPFENSDYPLKIFEILKECKVIIASRLHSIISAASVGAVPVALSYSSKCTAQMDHLDLDQYNLDIYSFTPSELAERVKKIIHDSQLQAELVDKIEDKVNQFRNSNQIAFELILELITKKKENNIRKMVNSFFSFLIPIVLTMLIVILIDIVFFGTKGVLMSGDLTFPIYSDSFRLHYKTLWLSYRGDTLDLASRYVFMYPIYLLSYWIDIKTVHASLILYADLLLAFSSLTFIRTLLKYEYKSQNAIPLVLLPLVATITVTMHIVTYRVGHYFFLPFIANLFINSTLLIKYYYTKKVSYLYFLPIFNFILSTSPHGIIFTQIFTGLLWAYIELVRFIGSKQKLKGRILKLIKAALHFIAQTAAFILMSFYWLQHFFRLESGEPAYVISKEIIATLTRSASPFNIIIQFGNWIYRGFAFEFIDKGFGNIWLPIYIFAVIFITLLGIMLSLKKAKRYKITFFFTLFYLFTLAFMSLMYFNTDLLYWLITKSPLSSIGWILRDIDKLSMLLVPTFICWIVLIFVAFRKSVVKLLILISIFIVYLIISVFLRVSYNSSVYVPRYIPDEFYDLKTWYQESKKVEDKSGYFAWYPIKPDDTYWNTLPINIGNFPIWITDQNTYNQSTKASRVLDYTLLRSGNAKAELLNMLGVEYVGIRSDALNSSANEALLQLQQDPNFELVYENSCCYKIFRNKNFRASSLYERSPLFITGGMDNLSTLLLLNKIILKKLQ